MPVEIAENKTDNTTQADKVEQGPSPALEDASAKDSTRNISTTDFSKAQSTIDSAIDGKGNGLVLVDEKDKEKVRNHMKEEATELTKGLKADGAAFPPMMNKYFDLQKMFGEAKSLGGDPKATMESVLNSALKDKGHKVSILDSTDKNAPKIHWQKSVEAIMTIDLKPDARPNSMGKGIIGLGHIKH